MSAKPLRLVPAKPRLREVLEALDYAHQSELAQAIRIQSLVDVLLEARSWVDPRLTDIIRRIDTALAAVPSPDPARRAKTACGLGAKHGGQVPGSKRKSHDQ